MSNCFPSTDRRTEASTQRGTCRGAGQVMWQPARVVSDNVTTSLAKFGHNELAGLQTTMQLDHLVKHGETVAPQHGF